MHLRSLLDPDGCFATIVLLRVILLINTGDVAKDDSSSYHNRPGAARHSGQGRIPTVQGEEEDWANQMQSHRGAAFNCSP